MEEQKGFISGLAGPAIDLAHTDESDHGLGFVGDQQDRLARRVYGTAACTRLVDRLILRMLDRRPDARPSAAEDSEVLRAVSSDEKKAG